ncbi:hypothetical protein FQR65_LT15061 [Abscondita terminalis]|nr:hypothetical protein FQR65_LT15061 [Abscondita terminalis]
MLELQPDTQPSTSFQDLSPIPTIPTTNKPNARKQHAEIITSPEVRDLKRRKMQEKLVKQNKKLEKDKKKLKNQKQAPNKKTRSKVFQEKRNDSSEDSGEEDLGDIDLSPIPTIPTTNKPNARKQHAEIITSPEVRDLKRRKMQEKLVKQNKKLEKDKKKLKNQKQAPNKKTRSKVFQEKRNDSSEDSGEEDLGDIVSDHSSDHIESDSEDFCSVFEQQDRAEMLELQPDTQPSTSFQDLSPIPTIPTTNKPNARKQHAEIITSPEVRDLKRRKMQEKLVKQNKKLEKDKKKLKNQKQAPNKKTRSKVFQEKRNDSSEDSGEEDLGDIVSDHSSDHIESDSEDFCSVCKGYYKDKSGPKVDWICCVGCYKWLHETCTPYSDNCPDCMP